MTKPNSGATVNSAKQAAQAAESNGLFRAGEDLRAKAVAGTLVLPRILAPNPVPTVEASSPTDLAAKLKLGGNGAGNSKGRPSSGPG